LTYIDGQSVVSLINGEEHSELLNLFSRITALFFFVFFLVLIVLLVFVVLVLVLVVFVLVVLFLAVIFLAVLVVLVLAVIFLVVLAISLFDIFYAPGVGGLLVDHDIEVHGASQLTRVSYIAEGDDNRS
jgi:hypothetical protein